MDDMTQMIGLKMRSYIEVNKGVLAAANSSLKSTLRLQDLLLPVAEDDLT